MNKEKPISFYDAYYEKKGITKEYAIESMIAYVVDELKIREVKTVLDVGCGSGFVLARCEANGIAGYGFDFSSEAIKLCKEYYGLKNVWVGDATKIDNFKGEYDAYLCLEVLEHIELDLVVLKYLKSGVLFIFSVPSWASRDGAHVRCFKTDNQIKLRYGDFVNIESIALFKTRRVAIGRVK